MATELKNANEDAEMADCDGEKVVTMMDVLQEQEDFEEDVNAVLGASDEKDCTYPKGYIKRQAIYACMTCCSDAKDDPTKRAGVCLACSLTCHENHDLIELYTKRNFKCDCGNPKFNSHPCQFTPNKTDLNEENNYNQNFSGVYCVCQRPYPDPESTEEIEMIQCIICEDWLHASHLEATVPDNDQYSEMICKGCMEKNEFLHDYGNLAVNIDVDVVTNGIDDDKMCNGDEKLEMMAACEDKIVKPTDVEMTEKASDIITSNAEESSEKMNGDNSNKNEENLSGTKESCDEEKDKEKSVDTSMETEESKQLDSNSTEEPTESVTEELSEKLHNEDVDEQNKNTNDTTTDKPLDSESVTPEQQNENKELATESTSELENTEIVKSTEQLEEERLLADPDDDIKKSNAEDKADIKEDEADKISETKETSDITNENENEVDSAPKSDEKQNECQNKEDSTISEIQAEETSTENATIETDKTATAEIEMEDNLKENVAEIEEENLAEIEKENVDEVEMEDNLKENVAEIEKENEAEIEKENVDEIEKENVDEIEKENVAEIEKENDIVESNAVIQNGDTEHKITEKRKLSIDEDTNSEIKKTKLECVRPKGVQKVHKGATFWPSTFRQKLCTCSECISMYKDLSVLFLIDPEDTVTAYENLGKQKINGKPASQYEKGLQALSSLDRIQQINALTEYNKMRDKLLDFLKSFKDRREVVKEEDIKAFFAGMKPKREPDGVYFCR